MIYIYINILYPTSIKKDLNRKYEKKLLIYIYYILYIYVYIILEVHLIIFQSHGEYG